VGDYRAERVDLVERVERVERVDLAERVDLVLRAVRLASTPASLFGSASRVVFSTSFGWILFFSMVPVLPCGCVLATDADSAPFQDPAP
jgi:hypothetical protein